MAKRGEATRLPAIRKATPKVPVIGVFATSDPRIDEESRTRCQNIAQMAAETISGAVVMPDKTPVPVVYSTVLVDGEAQADIVAQQFRKAGRRYPGLRAGHVGLPAADADLAAAAIPGRHADQHHLRQQRPQAGRGLCPRRQRRPGPVRPAGGV